LGYRVNGSGRGDLPEERREERRREKMKERERHMVAVGVGFSLGWLG